MSTDPPAGAPLRASVAGAAGALPGPGGERFVPAMASGTLLVELYAPVGSDDQQPHDRDELYVVVSGTGRFRRDPDPGQTVGSDEILFGPGDVLFVPAGVPHRFVEFSDDFSTWVVFYGPPGGEGRPSTPTAPDQGEAERYTHGHHESVLRAHRRRTAENSAGYLLDHLRPGMRILDVGCGPGSITCDLAERVAPGTVVGIDRSEDALTEARRTAAARGVAGASFEVGDVYHLDHADDSFDVVHAHQVLQHLVDPVAALREMRRVCRPGGIVAARDADYAAFTWAPADPALDLWLTTYRQVARANRAEPDAGRHLLGWANAAGFSEVTPGASTWCYATPEDRRWWAETSAERVTRSALAEQFREQGLTDDDLHAIAEAWHRWAEHPDGWFLLPHGEILARP